MSLIDVARGALPSRPVLAEYHAIGSMSGGTMLRHGRWKYCHYVGERPQLFDLEADPEELVDLATDPALAEVLAECDAALLAVVDPKRSMRGRRRGSANCSTPSADARLRSRVATLVSPPPLARGQR